MNDFLYKLLSLVLPLTISNIIYLKVDKRYSLTKKLSLKLHIKQEWMAFWSACLLFITMLIVGILGVYVIHIPDVLYFALGGTAAGIVNGMKIPNKIHLEK